MSCDLVDRILSRRKAALWLAAIAGFAGTSCSSGPTPPQPGTAAFFWASANSTYKAGNFPKTAENLQRIVAGESEFTARARAWDIVISSGLAQGYSEFADTYEAGAKMNRANPTPFRKQIRELRNLAANFSVQMTEDIHQFRLRDKEAQTLLAFAFPAGSTVQPAGLKRIAGGIVVQDTERDLLLEAMLQRGVLRRLCNAVGSPDDPAKALEIMKGADVRVPRETFLLAAARALEEQSALFGPTRLDQPERIKLMLQEALEALQPLPKTAESKALTDKVQRALKKLGTPGV